MSNTYTVWGVNGATRLAMNQHHMAGVLRMRGGLEGARPWPPVEAPAGSYTVTVGPRGEVTREAVENATRVAALDVQEALYLLGYKGGDGRPLTLDGEWGPNSRAAYRAFIEREKKRAHDALLDEYTNLPANAPESVLEPVRARMRDSDSYWDDVLRHSGGDTGDRQISLPFGLVRQRLFRTARPDALPGREPSPGQTPPGPPAPDMGMDRRETLKEEETDWTTWLIAGTGVVIAGVALWAIFRKRRKG